MPGGLAFNFAETVLMEDLEIARKALEKGKGEKSVSQKMFRVI